LAPEASGRPYRLIGVGLSGLIDLESEAADLFSGDESRARRNESLVDSLRDRFGAQAVVNPRLLRRRSGRVDLP
jgi:DNA polymerase-4